MTKFLIIYFLFLFFLSTIFSSGIIDSQDGFQYLAVARNIYYTHKPTAPVYEYDKGKNIHMSTYIGKDGNTYSPTGLGYSVALVPAAALTDLFYKIYHVSPPVHFPLESDWLIFLLASFTNNIFFALLGAVLLLYFTALKLSPRLALMMSLVTLFTTNLWVYSKDAFAHMMFTTFLFFSFYLVKRYFFAKSIKYLFFSGVAFGISSITYNQTFLLAVPSLVIYYLLLQKSSKEKFTKSVAWNFLIISAGFLPFFIISHWYDSARAAPSFDLSNVSTYASYANGLLKVPIGVFFEGLYGQLLSPGRSIFIYSPALLILVFFWHKIRSTVKPEFIAFIILSAIYIIFYATQYSTGKPTQGIASLWHGEASWGPRYLTTLLPFGMLLVGYILTQLSKNAKRFVLYPLLALGFYINFLGIVMPYQIKFHDLQNKFFVNSTEYTNYVYSNLLPRYSPILLMSKNLVKLARSFPNTLNHGDYNVRFHDGIDFPFNVGGERWRKIEGRGYIFFDNPSRNPIQKLSFGLINHPIGEASSSARIQFTLNNHLLKNSEPLALRERKLVEVPVQSNYLKPKNNQLIIDVLYNSPKTQGDFVIPENRNLSLLRPSQQILGMISFSINGVEVNKESLDFPYISQFGPTMTGAHYQNYGGANQDPWKSWDIHTQIYERVPDFWWAKALYYWDFPKTVLLGSFIGDLAIVVLLILNLKKYLSDQYVLK